MDNEEIFGDDLEDVQKACQAVLVEFISLQLSSSDKPLLNSTKKIRDAISNLQDEPNTFNSLESVMIEAISWMKDGNCNVFNPYYFGYISPRPHPAIVLGDFIASSMNQTPGAWRAGPAATVIEVQVLHWFRRLFELPPSIGSWPGGVFTGGGTIANLIALKLARDSKLGSTVKLEGLGGIRYVVYVSDEGHFSLDKAMDMLGLGSRNLIRVPSDEYGAIRTDILVEKIVTDIADGLIPLCIVATAGTTASGAVDPLDECSAVAKRFDMWFHVDGASGLAMSVIPSIRQTMKGLENADSITFDPCKWMFASFGVGCLLVKDGQLLVDAFHAEGHYWEEMEDLDTFKMNIYGTRQFRSLGIWAYLSHVGFDGYRMHIQNLLTAAQYFRDVLADDDRYSILEQHNVMPIICFQIYAENANERSKLSREVVLQCQRENIAYPTMLKWRNEVYLRVSVNNYTTKVKHMAQFKQKLDSIVDNIETIHRSR